MSSVILCDQIFLQRACIELQDQSVHMGFASEGHKEGLSPEAMWCDVTMWLYHIVPTESWEAKFWWINHNQSTIARSISMIYFYQIATFHELSRSDWRMLQIVILLCICMGSVWSSCFGQHNPSKAYVGPTRRDISDRSWTLNPVTPRRGSDWPCRRQLPSPSFPSIATPNPWSALSFAFKTSTAEAYFWPRGIPETVLTENVLMFTTQHAKGCSHDRRAC